MINSSYLETIVHETLIGAAQLFFHERSCRALNCLRQWDGMDKANYYPNLFIL